MALKNKLAKRLLSPTLQIRSYSAPAERSIAPAKQKYVPTSGTYPKGFLAGTSYAGVKKSNTSYDDVALVVSEKPCPAAAVYTRNIFQAAPLSVTSAILKHRQNDGIRGVVANSGCANAVTGDVGRDDAHEMVLAADNCFAGDVSTSGESPKKTETMRTLVMSTGVIGQRLPMDRITEAIPKAHAALGTSHDHWMRVAQAICTTDTFPKLISRTFTLPSHPETEYRIAGMTKGAGMIHPNMGTMLAIICTDAKIAPDAMTKLLRYNTGPSFNSITVDGDTSTNDTVNFFANGAAAPPDQEPLSLPERTDSNVDSFRNDMNDDMRAFNDVLRSFMIDLAQLIVRDGEGATKFVTVRVRSDHSFSTAHRAAMSIATSSLVKTALYGRDANWGRILCALGYTPGIIYDPYLQEAREWKSKQQISPALTSVSFVPSDGSGEMKLVVRGEPEEVDEERARAILEMEDLEILVRLEDHGDGGNGRKVFEAVVWTCDFSHEYVTINGDYRT